MEQNLAVAKIRSVARTTTQVSWAQWELQMMPANRSAANIEDAERDMSGTPDHLWSNTWFNDPVFLGSYPEASLREFGSAVLATTPQEIETIAAPLDFLGPNIYTGTYVKSAGDGLFKELPVPPGAARTAFD